MQLNNLTEEEKRVILGKGAEAPYAGKYANNTVRSVYVCRQCNAPLLIPKINLKAVVAGPALTMKLQKR